MSNDFKLFAGPSADTYTPAAWAALTTLLANGFATGVASTTQMNTLARQLSTVAAGIGQFISNTGGNALDNGDINAFATAFAAALSTAVIPSGSILMFPGDSAPSGFIKMNGAVPSIASIPSLAAAIYCGDANNATADFGYKCTNPASPTTTRSTAGTFIVLEDCRGRFPRAWTDGASIDSGRSLWSLQLDAFQGHEHTFPDTNNAGGGGYEGAGSVYLNRATNTIVQKSGFSAPRYADETRPINFPALFIQKV